MSASGMHGSDAGTENPQAVATLRQLKAAEASGQQRLDQTRLRGEADLKAAAAVREKLLSDARRDVETLRARRVQEAVAAADTQKLVAQAQAEAARLGNLSANEIDARTEDILMAVLGDLRPSATKRAATAR